MRGVGVRWNEKGTEKEDFKKGNNIENTSKLLLNCSSGKRFTLAGAFHFDFKEVEPILVPNGADVDIMKL